MKRFLILILLYFPFNSFSQNLTGGPWGMKFGMSRDSIISIASAKLASTPSYIDSFEVVFEKVKFDGYYTPTLKFKFLNNKYVFFHATFPASYQNSVREIYDDIKDKITFKYFKTNLESDNEVTVGSLWYFPKGCDYKNKKCQGNILLSISEDNEVILSYADTKKSDLLLKEIKTNQSSEY